MTAARDYSTEAPYIRQFCKDLGPTQLRAAAALAGHRTASEDDFDYCELGAGYGDTTATLAAAYPRARFVGVDLNPEHVAFARGLAQRGGLRNVRFLERDLGDLGGEALPDFDFVCAHGVLSWVSPQTRRALVGLASARLKPGGLLYVTYNALPGWAVMQPLRRWMLEAAGTGPVLDRARRALDAVRALRDGGARVVVSAPAVAEMVSTMLRLGPVYVAHEYLQEHWHPMHVSDVAAEMAGAGFTYAGQLPLYRNVARLAVPDGMAAALAAAPDAVAAEHVKDYATQAFFRGDVYVKGPSAADPHAWRRMLDDTPMGTLITADRLTRDVHLPHRALPLTGELFDRLVERLADRPATLPELVADPAVSRHGADRVREALVDLLAAEQIVPMRRSVDDVAPALRYNLAILDEPLAEGRPAVLASPVAGTAVAVAALQAVCLRLLTGVAPSAHRAWLRAYVDRHPSLKLHVRDRLVTDPAERTEVLAREVERFRVQRLPKLVALGVVEV